MKSKLAFLKRAKLLLATATLIALTALFLGACASFPNDREGYVHVRPERHWNGR